MINGSAALAILGGDMGGGGSAPTMSAIAAFRQYQRDQVGERTKFMNREDVQREIDYFRKQAGKTGSLEELIDNRRLLTFVATAFGLEQEATQPGKIKAILKSDPNDINSFANRLRDPRFGEMAKHFDIPNTGMVNLNRASKQDTLIQKYLTNSFEKDLSNKNPAVRDAVFFLRRINDVNSSYDVLGDMAMRKIVTEALNIPAQTANQTLSTQVGLIDRKLKLDKLKISSAEEAKLTLADALNTDITKLTEAIAKISSAEAQTSNLSATLTTSRTQLDDIANVIDTEGVFADEISIQNAAMTSLVRQSGLNSAAVSAIALVNTHLTTLDGLIVEARSITEQDELDSLQTTFQSTAESLKAAINNANYGADNLLLDDATAITTTLAVDGTAAITEFTDLSGFLSVIDTAIAGFNDVSLASLEDDLDSVKTDLEAGDTDLGDAERLVGLNDSSLNFAVSQVTFATALDTTSLATGVEAIQDAQSRSVAIRDLLAEISALAEDAQSDSADLDAINTSYAEALSSLSTAITSAGSVTDGTTTHTFDNLLNASTQRYTLFTDSDTDALSAEASSLEATIHTAMVNDYGKLTAKNASALKTAITNTYLTALDAADHHLSRDGAVIDFIAKQVDPQGRIDQTVIGQRNNLDQMIKDSAGGNRSFLSPYSGDLRVNFQSSVIPETVASEADFKTNVEASIDTYRVAVLSGANTADRRSALNDVLFTVGSTDGHLSSAKQQLTLRSSILSSERDELIGDNSENAFLKPLQNSAYAIKFMEQYLIRKEVQANGGSFGSIDIKASLVNLIRPIAPPIGGNINLFS